MPAAKNQAYNYFVLNISQETAKTEYGLRRFLLNLTFAP